MAKALRRQRPRADAAILNRQAYRVTIFFKDDAQNYQPPPRRTDSAPFRGVIGWERMMRPGGWLSAAGMFWAQRRPHPRSRRF
jgi:hypothetical protein